MKSETVEDKTDEILKSGEKNQHSRFGIASFLLYIAIWAIRLLIHAFAFDLIQYPLAIRIIDDYYSQFAIAVLIGGTVLGIASRFEADRKNRKNVFGIIGLLAHLLTLVLAYSILT